MGIKKKEGRWHVTRRWPDGSQFRRRYSTETKARMMLNHIEHSMILGTWREVRADIGKPGHDPTIEEFQPDFLSLCASRNRRPDFHKAAGVSVLRILGKVRLKDIRRPHAFRYITEREKEGVAPATINRGLAVLKSMLSLALEKGLIDKHPLVRFRMLPEPETILNVPSAEEVSRVIHAAHDPVFAALIAVTAETGMRRGEATGLTWNSVNLVDRMLSLEGKSGRVRHVPLTEMAMEWLRSVPRIVGIPWVFHRDGKRRLTIRYAWKAAKDEAKVECRFHDLRHYRASSWVRLGVDLRTVQELRGHADIHTTMRYSHFAPSHAVRAVREAERLERKLEETNSDRDNSVKQETG